MKETKMLNKKELNNDPQTLNDLIFGSNESKLRVYEIISGAEPLPSSGKSAILLYGVYGTGKTTMAKMLPNAIEKGKTNEDLVFPEEFIKCQQGFNGPQVTILIENIMSRSSLNASGLQYIILDEVDNLTKQAQQSLKTSLNTNRGIFILTTNHISELDKGLLDRCVLIEVNAASEMQLLPLAHRIALRMNAEISDNELLPTIKAANGSFRNLTHNIERLIRRRNVPQNIIF